jgi:hypothetical protein
MTRNDPSTDVLANSPAVPVPALLALATLAIALCAASSQVLAQPEFCEQDGFIILEIESTPPTDSWVEETSIPGFTGSSYYRWTGPNQFTNPGVGTLTYTLHVTTPGEYNLRIRNLHDDPDNGEENDCWTRLDGSLWLKTYSSINLTWNFATWFDPSVGSNSPASYFLSAGTHTFDICGRSNDFRIDRAHFYLDGVVGGQNPTYPETTCGTWVDLGNGLAGTGAQVPLLTGSGHLTSGSETTVSLSNALAGAPAYFVVGLNLFGGPFKGGTMVPTVDFLVGPLPVDGLGAIDIDFTWPAGIPGGVSVYYQTWVVDFGGVFGFSASNGLQSIAP